MVQLDPAKVDELFETYQHQADVLVSLYKMVLGDFKLVKDGFPKANKSTWEYLCNKFIEFDRKNHPKVMAGGLWLNSGFSKGDGLNDWEIDVSNCKILYE